MLPFVLCITNVLWSRFCVTSLFQHVQYIQSDIRRLISWSPLSKSPDILILTRAIYQQVKQGIYQQSKLRNVGHTLIFSLSLIFLLSSGWCIFLCNALYILEEEARYWYIACRKVMSCSSKPGLARVQGILYFLSTRLYTVLVIYFSQC